MDSSARWYMHRLLHFVCALTSCTRCVSYTHCSTTPQHSRAHALVGLRAEVVKGRGDVGWSVRSSEIYCTCEVDGETPSQEFDEGVEAAEQGGGRGLEGRPTKTKNDN